MAKKIMLSDIQVQLKLATSTTKELVSAGVSGADKFPELFRKYTWRNTRDYNMALIIVAVIQYCLKKNISLGSINSESIFEMLKKGNGNGLKKEMSKKTFMDLLQEMMGGTTENNEPIINAFLKRVGKITKWIVNGKDVESLVDALISSKKQLAEKQLAEKQLAEKQLAQEKMVKQRQREVQEELNALSTNADGKKREAAKSAVKKALLTKKEELAVPVVERIVKQRQRKVQEELDDLSQIPEGKHRRLLAKIASERALLLKKEELAVPVAERMEKQRQREVQEELKALSPNVERKKGKKRKKRKTAVEKALGAGKKKQELRAKSAVKLKELWEKLKGKQELTTKSIISPVKLTSGKTINSIVGKLAPYWYNDKLGDADEKLAQYNKWYVGGTGTPKFEEGKKTCVLLFPTKTAFDPALRGKGREEIEEIIFNVDNWKECYDSPDYNLWLGRNAQIDSIDEYYSMIGLTKK